MLFLDDSYIATTCLSLVSNVFALAFAWWQIGCWQATLHQSLRTPPWLDAQSIGCTWSPELRGHSRVPSQTSMWHVGKLPRMCFQRCHRILSEHNGPKGKCVESCRKHTLRVTEHRSSNLSHWLCSHRIIIIFLKVDNQWANLCRFGQHRVTKLGQDSLVANRLS